MSEREAVKSFRDFMEAFGRQAHDRSTKPPIVGGIKVTRFEVVDYFLRKHPEWSMHRAALEHKGVGFTVDSVKWSHKT